MRVAVLALTKGGKQLSTTLCTKLTFTQIDTGAKGIKETLRSIWKAYDGIIFIMAAGIAVRAIAPLIKDKNTDPCVLVLDEGGRFVISLLSGHIGGGNTLSEKVADAIGATAVITTASDVLGHTAIDLWARHNQLLANKKTVTQLSSILVNNGKLHVITKLTGQLPKDFVRVDDADKADCLIAHQKDPARADLAILRPKSLVIGIGCNRGTDREEIDDALRSTCAQNDLEFEAIESLASIDLKKDEAGLLAVADLYQLPLIFYSAAQLNTIEGLTPSQAVYAATGAYGVSEPAALLQANSSTLIVEKTKWKNVTIAIAAKPINLTAHYL